jgi:hypothetical protein
VRERERPRFLAFPVRGLREEEAAGASHTPPPMVVINYPLKKSLKRGLD